MRAVITVVGKDMVGILAKVSAICAENKVNIVEVTQSILQDMFCMIMMADLSECTVLQIFPILFQSTEKKIIFLFTL